MNQLGSGSMYAREVKKVESIDQLPEPFRSYWTTPDSLGAPCEFDRNFQFWMIDGELYIRDTGWHNLASHWTQSSCAGIANFMQKHNISMKSLPYVHVPSGQRMFLVGPTGLYETSVWLADGTSVVVHSG